ncbi:MAG: hypothetical protein HYZ89_03255, partial [Candidatus Omnitrophica bacterium]|nr:hypothetical protein [Candidatus Omnitrophota bacterium]
VGICGGFQMLGEQILDPDHLEASVSAAPGLGMLPVVTVFEKEKVVSQTRGLHITSDLPVAGYEIHMGRMRQEPRTRRVLKLTERSGVSVESYDGAENENGTIWGTHLHGLFDAEPFRRWWLNRLRQRRGLPALTEEPGESSANNVYDRLAAAIRPHLDMTTIYSLFTDH